MLVCGLELNPYGPMGANLVVLDPNGMDIAHTSKIEPPFKLNALTKWLRSEARRFAPDPLWVAVADIDRGWLDALGTAPVRWIHYATDAMCGYMPNSDEVPDGVSREALALARALTSDLADLRLYHQEMFYLSLIRDSAQRLTELLPRTRFQSSLRSLIPSEEDGMAPF